MQARILVIAATLAAGAAQADTPAALLTSYASEAVKASPGYPGPSAASGDRFFHQRHKDWSCASCHTDDPSRVGRHVVTGKPIKPLAPSANPQRFVDRNHVEKWFRRNCKDTLGRECTAAEKANVLAYLLGIGKGGRP